MSFIGNILNKIPGIPKGRSGKLTQTRFGPEENKSPIRDAVQLTNTMNEGGKQVLNEQTTRVRMKNGSSLVGDGTRIQVLDSKGKETELFPGKIDVAEGHVTIRESQDNRSQTFAADGQIVLDDNGLLVQMSPDGTARSLRSEGDTWLPGAEGKVDGSTLKFENGDVAYPIFKQSWLSPESQRT